MEDIDSLLPKLVCSFHDYQDNSSISLFKSKDVPYRVTLSADFHDFQEALTYYNSLLKNCLEKKLDDYSLFG